VLALGDVAELPALVAHVDHDQPRAEVAAHELLALGRAAAGQDGGVGVDEAAALDLGQELRRAGGEVLVGRAPRVLDRRLDPRGHGHQLAARVRRLDAGEGQLRQAVPLALVAHDEAVGGRLEREPHLGEHVGERLGVVVHRRGR
jgi:hypothetical protein